mmetsp:Transcript_16721/g.18591  ORF Transcript_16721/g.18591 Transcript_16721/m.18591 type:complete len:779 (+) Transcript_16721:215-2551(+)
MKRETMISNDENFTLSMLKKIKKRPTSNNDVDDFEYRNDGEYVDNTKLKRKRTNNGSSSSTSSKKRSRLKPDGVVSSSSPKMSSGSKKPKSTSTEKEKKKTQSVSSRKPRELKKLEKTERLQYAMQAFLWWNAPSPPEGCQWRTMEHAGVSFPDPYQPHGIKMLYNGEPLDLTPVQEEAATFFAAMDPEGMHLGSPKTAKIFIKNFFADFKALLGRRHIIKDFAKCDFGPIQRHLNEQKIIKKAITDEEKKVRKAGTNRVLFHYGFALVDGHLERVGNYNMEPPGTFRGRGAHPKMGKIKARVIPEQVQLNFSECAPVPRCPMPGHAWGEVRHDPQVQWLAQWKENINNQLKYMQMAAQSSFKGKSDRQKYSKAALLCDNINKIRTATRKALRAKKTEERQLATAVWVIDRLALRVGGEKDTDEEADTVGCCSLRVEHMTFDPNEEGGDNKEIELEFLGKDSMLYKQTIDFGSDLYNQSDNMGKQVYDNFKKFCKNKRKSEEIFDKINPTMLNQHLKQFMDGLTAKVFRTYNASKTLQEELAKKEQSSIWKSLTASEKVVEYNNGNREVAILCNHQRSVSKAQETQLETLGNKLHTLKKQKKILKKMLKLITAGKTEKIPLKKSEKEMIEAAGEAIAKAKRMKEEAKTNEEKIAATEADEAAKQQRRDCNDAKFVQAHLWDKIPTQDQVIKKINSWTAKIAKKEMDLKHKDDNKEVSLGTSKINYMDPRISVAWCKRNEVPIEKIFPISLRGKFNWAMAVKPDWEFNASIAKQKWKPK